MDRRQRSAGAIVFSLSATFLALLGAAYAVGFAALGCDESCDGSSTNWRDNPDAWQWDGTLVIAGLALLSVFYALGAAAAGRRCVPALVASAVLWAAWWALVTW